jgi:hypothetical protein
MSLNIPYSLRYSAPLLGFEQGCTSLVGLAFVGPPRNEDEHWEKACNVGIQFRLHTDLRVRCIMRQLAVKYVFLD